MNVVFLVGVPDRAPPRLLQTPEGVGAWFPGSAPIIAPVSEAMKARGWTCSVKVVGKDPLPLDPPPDLFINCICEPAITTGALGLIEKHESKLGAPLVNPLQAVRRSTRAELAGVLAGLGQVAVPRTTLYERAAGGLAAHIEARGHALPVLIRPIGVHSGEGLVLVERATEQPVTLRTHRKVLVTDFVDFRSGDGLYRKYRVVCVGAAVVHRHLVINDTWRVGGADRRFMGRVRPELMVEEKAFLAGVHAEVDELARAIVKRLGLDFSVLNFALGDDGVLTVFEVNACFQITGSIPARFREKYGNVEASNAAVVEAFVTLAESRAVALPGGPPRDTTASNQN